MPVYHVALWFAAALSSVLLALAVIGLAVISRDQQTASESGLAAVLTLALGTMFTLAMTCLGLRRDFVRPLTGVVIMAVLFMGVLTLLAVRIGRTSKHSTRFKARRLTDLLRDRRVQSNVATRPEMYARCQRRSRSHRWQAAC